MLYLANPCSDATIEAMRDGLLGMIDTPYQAKAGPVDRAHAAGALWCADNGAFTSRWDPDTWWLWLNAERQINARPRCLFATAPDVVGDAAATLERSRPWLPRLRDLGYPAAYVGQNGATPETIPWDDFDVLFLGGDTAWKIGPAARLLAEAAVARGKPVHMGRVNSERRWRYAHTIGCSTVDGTYLTFGPDTNLPDLLAWGRNNHQPALF